MATPSSHQDESPHKSASASKKQKKGDVLTFSSDHSPVQVQLLSSHTLYDLVDTFCRKTCIGDHEAVYDHLWRFNIGGQGNDRMDRDVIQDNVVPLDSLNLTVGTNFLLDYDCYGSPSSYQFRLESRDTVGDEESTADFPREKTTAKPNFAPHTTDAVDLASLEFSKWGFQGHFSGAEVNLFQPGRKQNYGYMCRVAAPGLKQMIHVATKADSLTEYVHVLDTAAKVAYKTTTDSYPAFNWHSILVFPQSLGKDAYRKVEQERDRGFCDYELGPECNDDSIDTAFPKIAALGGFRKDKKVPKGWITYHNSLVLVCTGAPVPPPKSNAPAHTAFLAMDCHKPGEVLLRASEKCSSLHELFCFVEGFLSSL